MRMLGRQTTHASCAQCTASLNRHKADTVQRHTAFNDHKMMDGGLSGMERAGFDSWVAVICFFPTIESFHRAIVICRHVIPYTSRQSTYHLDGPSRPLLDRTYSLLL